VRFPGCFCLFGSIMKRWYCACALWTMNSSPPLMAIPYCPSGALILEMSFLKCAISMDPVIRRRAVPIPRGRFFFKSFLSL
jgi:hypothetical protein